MQRTEMMRERKQCEMWDVGNGDVRKKAYDQGSKQASYKQPAGH